MSFDIDSGIFVVFLVATVIIGLFSSRGTNTIRQYAIGDRNFSTATIVATIVATWVSGEFFYSHVSEVYATGLHAIWAFVIGDVLSLFLMGFVFVPRMGEFLGKLSIAEAMGSLFGERIRVITAIASFIGTAGIIAIQLKLAGLIFEYALDIPSIYGILIATFIVTLYSSLGGIKSVTFTDVIQFFTFGVAIPLSAYVLLTSIDNADNITNTITNNHLFDYKKVFDFSEPLALKYLFLFLFFAVPSFGPTYFQRTTIAKNTRQASRAFILAATTCGILAIIVDWSAVLILSINPSLDPNEAVKHMLLNSSYVGLKGLMLAGVMAMIMSTVDSYINSTAVIIVHDFFKPLKMQFARNEIFAARIVSVIIGLAALVLSLHEGSLLELLVITASFYAATVSTPFLIAVLGFRSSEKSVIIGMIAGLITVITWNYILHIKVIDCFFVGMIINLMFLFGSHYLLKQPGGWVGIKDKAPLEALRLERKLRWENFINSIKNFNIIEICRKNTPTGDGLISILGFFVMIVAFSATHTLAKEYQLLYAPLINILYPITLCSSALLISYPLWLPQWREFDLVGVVWNIIMFFVLICFTFLMVLISNFSEIQVIVFMLSVIVSSLLIGWQWALFTIVLGVTSVNIIYYKYIVVDSEVSVVSSELKIIYLLLMLTSVLITFLKPKQEYLKTTENKVGELGAEVGTLKTQTKVLEKDVFNFANENYNLASRVRKLDYEVEERSRRAQHQEYEIQRLGAAAEKILNNVNHELRLPVGNVMNFAAMLHDAVEKYDKTQLKELTDEVYKNSTRLSSMILNMLDLATLNVQKVDLRKTLVNLSEIVMDRVSTCRKIYLQDKPIDFELSVQQEIMVTVDPNYMRQTIDNLVINAIKFSEKGLVKISLTEKNGKINFTIIDQGKGIPQGELSDIFQAFKMGSNSESKASGRGVGLALCKAVIEAHGGEIKAESNGVSSGGAKFWFELN